MRPFLLLCFAIIIILCFNSCDICSCKKVLCPAFENADFSAWFPYNNAQTVVFKNDIGSADTIYFDAMQKSTSYEIKRGCLGNSGICSMNARVSANAILSNSTIPIDIYFYSYSEQSQNVSVSFGNFQLESSGIDNNGLNDILSVKYSADFYPQVNINGTNFTNIQVITKDTTSTSSNGIYKLFLSRNNGIVGYEHYPSLETWIKQ